MATIKDVAKRANVSTTTVSHVINKTRFVAEETRNAVWAAIKELHYSPSAVARSLKVNHTKSIGLLATSSEAAYFAEIYRGGIESIPRGQYEAAQVLGYTKAQTFFRIILPQMVKRVIPAVSNEVITLVKDTSLASVIGTVEMFTRAKQIVASPNTPGMLALVAAGVFYYVFNYVVAFAMEKWEQALRYYR